jgi:hypothetical protein
MDKTALEQIQFRAFCQELAKIASGTDKVAANRMTKIIRAGLENQDDKELGDQISSMLTANKHPELQNLASTIYSEGARKMYGGNPDPEVHAISMAEQRAALRGDTPRHVRVRNEADALLSDTPAPSKKDLLAQKIRQAQEEKRNSKANGFAAFDAKTPAPTLLARMGSEGAEHATDLGGLGLMMGANADRIRESLTGKAVLSPGKRDAMDLLGLGVMAVPSIAAAMAARKGANIAGLAGRGDVRTNVQNAVSLAALATPILDRIQARARGDEEGKQLLGARAHAALEVAGYGGLAHNVAKARALPGVTPTERRGFNSVLAGYGLLAAPEAAHLVKGHHPEHAQEHDAEGNPIPRKGAWVRPVSDMVALSLLGAPVVHSMATGHHLDEPPRPRLLPRAVEAVLDRPCGDPEEH